MNVNGIEFTPQEAECIAIALDRMQELQEEAAESARDDDAGHAAICDNEARVAEATREKWGDVRRAARSQTLPMRFQDFYNRAVAAFPAAVIEEDGERQLVISTGLMEAGPADDSDIPEGETRVVEHSSTRARVR